MRLLVLVALLAASPAAAWGGVRGDGQKTTTRRDLPPFTGVSLQLPVDVKVKVGGAQSVAVTIDGNLQQHLVTRVDGGTLVIDSDENLDWEGVALVEVSVPRLAKLAVEGAGDALVEGSAGGDLALVVAGSGDVAWKGSAARLEARVMGSGDVQLSGKAERLEVSIAGSGDVDAHALTAGAAEVHVSGSGDVQVRLAGGPLSANVAGSGTVRWFGDAKVERAVVAGSGEVLRGE